MRSLRRAAPAEIRVDASDERTIAPTGELVGAPMGELAADGLDPQRWGELARKVLTAWGVVGPAEMSLSFVDEAEIAELNERWLDESGPTDVLSFPLDDPRDSSARSPDGMCSLGDVVVCPSVARRYAVEHGREPDAETALLVVHGVLHVLGYDHAEADEEATMQALEERYLTEFFDPKWSRTAR